jgi:parvulin-like peptidyl-prolyl isomerase
LDLTGKISMDFREYRMSLSFILLMIFFSAEGCGQWGGGLPEDVLAQVNQEQITLNEFNQEFKEVILQTDKEANRGSLRDLKQSCLNQMIERKILVQEARRLGIKVSQEELDRALFEIKMDYPGEGFGEKLNLKGMTLEEWRVGLEEKLLAEKMIRTSVQYRGEIDEKEVLQYYETHRSSFQLNQRVRARQIVVADGEEAIQILKRLKRGESFEKVAAEKSLGPEKVNGGDLGYFSRGERPAEFDRVFEMEVGRISEVIKSPYGYHIFKLEEKIEARQIPFEEAKLGIIQKLRENKWEEEFQKWFKGLKAKARVKINTKWLNS